MIKKDDNKVYYRSAEAEARVKVFEDTLEMINNSAEIQASIKETKKNTVVFYENDYPDFNSSKTYDTQITVTKNRSFEAAVKLHKDDNNSKIAVVNFANAFHAGGGVTKGSSAQEECLCRTSNLYPCIYRRTLRDSFYRHHHNLKDPRATDSLVYTPGIVILKTDEDLPERLSQKDWVTVDVITIAAPDLREKSNRNAELVGNGTYMSDAELFGCHVKRAIHMFACAAAMGADTLVLGAFGCGAFRNNPEVVARAYKIALAEFPNVFKRIEFAVYCRPKDQTNYEVFNRILG